MDLTTQLLRKVIFLGNPFMDPVWIDQSTLQRCTNRLGLLPGSWRPELEENLLLLLRLIESFPLAQLFTKDISFDIPLVPTLDDAALRELVASHGWEFRDFYNNDSGFQLVHNQLRVNIHRDSFSKVV